MRGAELAIAELSLITIAAIVRGLDRGLVLSCRQD